MRNALQNIERGASFLDDAASRSLRDEVGKTSQRLCVDELGRVSPPAGITGALGTSVPLVTIGIHDFINMQLPAREVLMTPWLLSQSLNMLHAWRGVGKTQVALEVAYAVASGGQFLHWQVSTPAKVLYIDGEMPGPTLQERLAAIVAAADTEPAPGMFNIITPDLQTSYMPDLATVEGQAAINALLEEDTRLIVVDNLSCLARSGGKENDAESWIRLSEWGLAMRAQGRSVLFIHHSGKNGAQRGTSRREDLLDTVLCLKRPPDYDPSQGAVFEVHYEKARNLYGDDTHPIEARLTQDEQGKRVWTTRPVAESTLDKVVELAKEGLTQSQIAEELEVNRSTVSRACRKAEELGLIPVKPKSRTQSKPDRRFPND